MELAVPPPTSPRDCLHFFGFSCLTVEGSPGFKLLDALRTRRWGLTGSLGSFARFSVGTFPWPSAARLLSLPSLPQLCRILRKGKLCKDLEAYLGDERRKGDMGQGERGGCRI